MVQLASSCLDQVSYISEKTKRRMSNLDCLIMSVAEWLVVLKQVEEDRSMEVYQFPPPKQCPCRKANKIKTQLELISQRLCSLLEAEETVESLSDVTEGINDLTEQVNGLAEMLRLEVSIQVPETAGRSPPHLAERAWSMVSDHEADPITFVKDSVCSLNSLIPRLLCVSTCYCPSPSSKEDQDILANNEDLDIMSMVANMSTGSKIELALNTGHNNTFNNLEEDDNDIMNLVAGMVAKDDVATDDSDILSLVSGMVGNIDEDSDISNLVSGMVGEVVEVGDIDEDSGKFEPPLDSSQKSPSIAEMGRQTMERARKRKQKNPTSRSPKLSPNSRKKARKEAESMITMRSPKHLAESMITVRRPFQENRAPSVLRMLENKRKNSKYDGLCQFVLWREALRAEKQRDLAKSFGNLAARIGRSGWH